MILLKTFTVDNLEIDCVQMESNDLHQIIICKNEIIKETPPNLFIPPNDTYISTILNGYGRTLALLHCNKLIAVASVVFPKTGKHNLGKYLEFDDFLLNQVAQFEHGFVLSNYRGHGLLKILLTEHLKYIETKYSFFLSTVSPYNIPSLKSGFSIGQVIKSHICYHGFERYVLCKKISNTYSFANAIKCNNNERLDFYLSTGYIAVYSFEAACFLIRLEEEGQL
ncbi:MAG: hypothetical protein NC180_00050 [Muribaculaceae bacterium]|nr:hypothetical protein [Muribaculaceae bacterium]MCM1441409.1 hypothetical protein [Roseburia sp.]MCM1491604.1 hypothetical protein [Muribaculaceae bacterium]